MLEPPGSEAMLSGSALQQTRGRLLPILAVFLTCLAVVGVAPYLLDTYSVNVLTRSLLYACVALTVDLLWGYMGILTFGQSAFFAAGAYSAGLFFTHSGFGPGTALARAGDRRIGRRRDGADRRMAGILARGKRALRFGHYAGTADRLHAAALLRRSVYRFEQRTVRLRELRSFRGSLVLDRRHAAGGSGRRVMGIREQRRGPVLVAIRENEQRCQYLGLDTPRLKIILFVACAVVGAITGYVFACYSMVVAPELAGFVFGTELVIYTVLGGRATLIGPVLATIIVDYESAQLSGDYPFVWKLILGTVFVVVIVAFPRGLLPFVGDLGAVLRLPGADRRTHRPQTCRSSTCSTLRKQPESRPGAARRCVLRAWKNTSAVSRYSTASRSRPVPENWSVLSVRTAPARRR